MLRATQIYIFILIAKAREECIELKNSPTPTLPAILNSETEEGEEKYFTNIRILLYLLVFSVGAIILMIQQSYVGQVVDTTRVLPGLSLGVASLAFKLEKHLFLDFINFKIKVTD